MLRAKYKAANKRTNAICTNDEIVPLVGPVSECHIHVILSLLQFRYRHAHAHVDPGLVDCILQNLMEARTSQGIAGRIIWTSELRLGNLVHQVSISTVEGKLIHCVPSLQCLIC